MVKCTGCKKEKKIFAKKLCRNCYEKQRPSNTTCDNCGTPIYISPGKQQADRFNYCSTTCLSKHRRDNNLLAGENNPAFAGGPITLTCAICQSEFERQRTQYNSGYEHQYCSTKCQHKGLAVFYSGSNSPHAGEWVTRPCNFCGKMLTRPEWAFNELAFCNRDCFGKWKSENWTGKDNPSWKGGYDAGYGRNWKRQSRRARARDNHACRRCEVTEKQLNRALDVHHIIRFADFSDHRKANRLSNLISLCHPCHMLVENGKG